MTGIVKQYDINRGYGSIAGDDGVDYFVRYSQIITENGVLEEGYGVSFMEISGITKEGKNRHEAYSVRYV